MLSDLIWKKEDHRRKNQGSGIFSIKNTVFS
jgi:hypothetical protein